MKHIACGLPLLLLLHCLAYPLSTRGDDRPQIGVVIGPDAPQLEQFAADQLCDYLGRLFNIQVQPTSSLPASAGTGLLVGTPETNPAVAEALVAAEADGLAGHGASRLPSYADQAVAGKVDGFATPGLTETAAAAVRVDARNGFAYPAIALGLDRAARLVEKTGVVAVAVGNSHHFGAAGYHVERLAEKGLLGLAFGNSPAAIAPWGGSRALFGTNPIACACPRAGAPPLVIDLGLSKAARGKVMVAAQKDEPIPEGWALDAEGRVVLIGD